MAFDVVKVESLLKRLEVIGLPSDVIKLIGVWLGSRYFYVSLEGSNSYVYYSSVWMVQGSVLGPILYSIFASPLFDRAKMALFADDNYVIQWNKNVTLLINDMQRTVE